MWNSSDIHADTSDDEDVSAVGSMYNVSRQVNFITTSILLQNAEVWSHVSEIEAEFEDRESCVVNQQIPVRFYIMFLLTWQSLFKVSDSGLNVLFLFLAMFLSLVISAIAKLQNLVKVLPRTIAKQKRWLAFLFRKYVSCPVVQNVILCIHWTSATLQNYPPE